MRIPQKAEGVIMRNLQCTISYVEKDISADFCICITVPLTSRINISLKRPKRFYSDYYSFLWDINSMKKFIIVSVKFMSLKRTLFQKLYNRMERC